MSGLRSVDFIPKGDLWVLQDSTGWLLAREGSSEATANRPSEKRALLPQKLR